MSAAERRWADWLTVPIEHFEENHSALKPADPATVLRELIEADGLKQKPPVDVFGTPSIRSEALSRKRKLTRTGSARVMVLSPNWRRARWSSAHPLPRAFQSQSPWQYSSGTRLRVRAK
jgi:hypothetical protein